MVEEVNVNLGCGLAAGASFINIDGSLNAFLANHSAIARTLEWLHVVDGKWRQWPRGIKHHDLRRKLPFRDGSVAGVYASHVLEHLTRRDAVRLLMDIQRVLRPKGVLRLVVPDLEAIIRSYVERCEARLSGSPDMEDPLDHPADIFLIHSGLGRSEESSLCNPLLQLVLQITIIISGCTTGDRSGGF